MKSALYIFLIFSLCLLSCSGNADNNEPKSSNGKSESVQKINEEADYFPISNGSKWEYNVEYTNATGMAQKGKAVTRVDGEETIDGKKYFKLVTVYSGIPGAEPQIEYSRKNKDGVYTIQEKHKDFGEYLEFPFPLVKRVAWNVKTFERETSCQVASIEKAELFDKSYDNCIKIVFQTANSNRKGYFYLAPNIGLIKAVLQENNFTWEQNIDSYKKQ